jgi:hypothetical protein
MKLTPREAVSGFSDVYKFDINQRASLGVNANLPTKIATIPPGGIVTYCSIYVVDQIDFGFMSFSIGTNAIDYNNFISSVEFSTLTKCAFNTGSAFTVNDDVNTLNGFVNNSQTALPVFFRNPLSIGPPRGGSGIICMRILEPSVFNF